MHRPLIVGAPSVLNAPVLECSEPMASLSRDLPGWSTPGDEDYVQSMEAPASLQPEFATVPLRRYLEAAQQRDAWRKPMRVVSVIVAVGIAVLLISHTHAEDVSNKPVDFLFPDDNKISQTSEQFTSSINQS